jgi:hypothetical protein
MIQLYDAEVEQRNSVNLSRQKRTLECRVGSVKNFKLREISRIQGFAG